jgi:hypothetical protein
MPVTGKPVSTVAKSVSYVKFSDKLSMSLTDISRMIEEHKTTSIGTLHTLTVKYAGIANNILDALLPIVNSLPIIPQSVKTLLTNLEAITQKIIDTNASTSRTITDVQSGLRTGDVNKIKGHAGQLQALTRSLTSILPK